MHTTQQTFVGLQDVLKTSSRHVLKTSSTRLEDQQMFAGLYANFRMSNISWWNRPWSLQIYNFTVSRSGYLNRVNQNIFPNKCFVLSNWRYFFEIYIKKRNNNPLLSKSTLKYLVYYLVFWVEVQRLQNQWISIWALVFYYCISNNLSLEKIVIQI